MELRNILWQFQVRIIIDGRSKFVIILGNFSLFYFILGDSLTIVLKLFIEIYVYLITYIITKENKYLHIKII